MPMTRTEEAVKAGLMAGIKAPMLSDDADRVAAFIRALAERGFVVAPLEPTEGMLDAICDTGHMPLNVARETYAAVIRELAHREG